MFWQTRKALRIFKNIPEKNKNSKAIWAVLGRSNHKILSVGQPGWLTFFREITLYSFHFVEVRPIYWLHRYSELEFSTKFCSYAITILYILYTRFTTWWQLKTYIEDTSW